MKIMIMEAEMELMHELSNMDFHFTRPVWLDPSWPRAKTKQRS
jgi:hypothetical protein